MLTALVSCRTEDAAGPRASDAPRPLGAAQAVDTARVVTLAENARVFRVATVPRDSTGLRARLLLGHVRLAPTHDDNLTLRGSADTAVLRVAGGLGVTVLLDRREVARVTLAELNARAISIPVHVGNRAVAVLLDRGLPARATNPVLDGAFHLELASSSTVVQQRVTPWVRARGRAPAGAAPRRSTAPIAPPSGIRRSTSVDDGCSFDDGAAQGTCGTVGYQIDPFVSYYGDATFQSDDGTGPSRPITVTFAAPVTTVNVVIGDPTWSGNTAVAYDSAGNVVASTGFDFSGVPGDDEPSERSLSAPAITKVVLTPAPDDYVYYMMSVNVAEATPTVQCTPGTVVRGDATTPVTCHAAKFNSITSWQFVSDRGLSVTRPAGTTGDWVGTVVTSGTVTVTGRAGGIPGRTASARVEVVARDWTTNAQPIDVQEVSQLAPPPRDRLPPRPERFDERFGRTNLVLQPLPAPQGFTSVVRDGGPNDGLAYFKTLPLHIAVEVRINRLALNPDSAFAQIQPPTDRVVDGRPLPVCGRDRFPALTQLFEAHEGLHGEDGSHARRLHDTALRRAAYVYEQYVGLAQDPPPGNLNDEIIAAAKANSALRDTTGYNNITADTVPCDFNYDYDTPIP